MTLINKNLISKRGVTLFLVMVASLSLSACGGSKKITTEDNSADYKSAKSLPPLKKPSRVALKSSSVNEQTTTRVVSNSDDSSSPELQALNSSVIKGSSGEIRLEIDANFDQSWDYLSTSLQKSDLTVFSRNKAAGRFSIGCTNIAAAPTVSKSGRWSIFNRSKKQNLEHCALQATEKRGNTIVSVLNRAGEEVSGKYSSEVFNRILNN